jgi:hypothetical protein
MVVMEERQLVRLDGTLMVSFHLAHGTPFEWQASPYDGPITGPVAGRARVLPDGPWIVIAYFPKGYPGPPAPFPEDLAMAMRAERLEILP